MLNLIRRLPFAARSAIWFAICLGPLSLFVESPLAYAETLVLIWAAICVAYYGVRAAWAGVLFAGLKSPFPEERYRKIHKQ